MTTIRTHTTVEAPKSRHFLFVLFGNEICVPVTVWEYNAEMEVTGRVGGATSQSVLSDDQIKADKTHRTSGTNRYMRDSLKL
jgi:hypothetical protein